MEPNGDKKESILTESWVESILTNVGLFKSIRSETDATTFGMGVQSWRRKWKPGSRLYDLNCIFLQCKYV